MAWPSGQALVYGFPIRPRLSTRVTDLAIMSSSSVRMTRTLTPTGIRRDQRCQLFALRSPVEFDAEKSETVANPLPDGWRVLADAAGEHQRVQPAQRRREWRRSISWPGSRTARPLRPPARLWFRGPAGRACRNWSPTRRAAPIRGSPFSENAPRSFARFARSRRARSRDPNRPSVCSSPSPAVGVKPMLVSMLLPSRTGGAGSHRSELGEDRPTLRRRRVAEAREFRP